MIGRMNLNGISLIKTTISTTNKGTTTTGYSGKTSSSSAKTTASGSRSTTKSTNTTKTSYYTCTDAQPWYSDFTVSSSRAFSESTSTDVHYYKGTVTYSTYTNITHKYTTKYKDGSTRFSLDSNHSYHNVDTFTTSNYNSKNSSSTKKSEATRSSTGTYSNGTTSHYLTSTTYNLSSTYMIEGDFKRTTTATYRTTGVGSRRTTTNVSTTRTSYYTCTDEKPFYNDFTTGHTATQMVSDSGYKSATNSNGMYDVTALTCTTKINSTTTLITNILKK